MCREEKWEFSNYLMKKIKQRQLNRNWHLVNWKWKKWRIQNMMSFFYSDSIHILIDHNSFLVFHRNTKKHKGPVASPHNKKVCLNLDTAHIGKQTLCNSQTLKWTREMEEMRPGRTMKGTAGPKHMQTDSGTLSWTFHRVHVYSVLHVHQATP